MKYFYLMGKHWAFVLPEQQCSTSASGVRERSWSRNWPNWANNPFNSTPTTWPGRQNGPKYQPGLGPTVTLCFTSSLLNASCNVKEVSKVLASQLTYLIILCRHNFFKKYFESSQLWAWREVLIFSKTENEKESKVITPWAECLQIQLLFLNCSCCDNFAF